MKTYIVSIQYSFGVTTNQKVKTFEKTDALSTIFDKLTQEMVSSICHMEAIELN